MFTSGTLYFTGRQHAGENIAGVLKQRAKQSSPPIQMCDARSRNVPNLPAGVEIPLANCLHVPEMLGHVYGHDAEARERGLTPEERFHQERSGPVMHQLHGWLEAQLDNDICLTELQRHARELAASPAEWMPWNYRETLARIVSLSDSASSYDESCVAGKDSL